jgi:hypothetical protein
MRHTKGPWKIHNGCGQCREGIEVVKYRDGRIWTVAMCHGFDGEPFKWGEETQANANLIAAAPDLLAALEAMLSVALRVDDHRGAEAIERGNISRPCDIASAAIAKARGEG